ncbi:hypothetical protein JTE90_011092 [Oedothorax gibbosus]|uniref:Apple domain-containing protein n=1 Tax=Oedothorax gibbosus TaxID=931172 RepID=A0AAV6TVX5_9ARAC|nr:hypothetical protein JTE90_011092 [Oedothorax gibbosus]
MLSLCFLLVGSASAFRVQQEAFTLPTLGFRLLGTQLKSQYTRSTAVCAQDCMRMSGCTAYNYKRDNGTCQLMAAEDLNQVEPDPEFQIVIKKLKCIENPCMNEGTCSNDPTSVHNIRGYKCHCPCGRCGSNCNKLHFGLVENACIYMFNAGYQKVENPRDCMSFCWHTQGCRSADYINSAGACWLNSVTGDEEPLTMDCDKWYPGVAYLFFNCTCDVDN